MVWRVYELCSDFKILDEWRLPVEVARDELPEFFRVFAANGVATDSRLAGALFRIRFAIGRALGWDAGPPEPIPGCSETTVAARLTGADRARDRLGAMSPSAPVEVHPIYLFDDEALVEIANKTIHALLHLGWEADGVRLTVMIKSRGRASDLYMAAIGPFRHRVVYPAWFRSIRRAWAEARSKKPATAQDATRAP